MDKSVPRVTVWHHSAEPRDTKSNAPWGRFVHPYLTLMSESYNLTPPKYRTALSGVQVQSCWTCVRRDVPVGVPLDLSTPTGMICIGTYGENCKSDNVS